MPLPARLLILVSMFILAGSQRASDDPIVITEGSLTATFSEFRFRVTGSGPLIADLFHSDGVFHTPLPNEPSLVGGISESLGAFRNGTFELEGISYGVPVEYHWFLASPLVWTTPGQPLVDWPFRLSGSFAHPGFGTVAFSGGGLARVDDAAAVWRFTKNPPAFDVVPEPASCILLGTGLAALLSRRRARSAAAGTVLDNKSARRLGRSRDYVQSC